LELYDSEPCYYCGLPASTIDHVVPIVIIKALLDLPDGLKRLKGRVLTVHACQQCNSIAGGRYFDTLSDRLDYVKKRLRQKLKKDLDCADHTDRDLMEMSEWLRDYCINGQERRRVALARLAHEPKGSKQGRSVSQVIADARRR
jgi:hypothetical protein